MKHLLRKAGIIISFCLCLASPLMAQNPGLLISEVLANPNGTDSPFEYIELIATKSITFSATPYCVVVSNNGTATSAGWIAGAGITYGFNITSGTVNAGDVVYVGGSSMAPTGTKLRVINTGTTAGDGFGNANTGGVVGNGGSNADGIAVFDADISTITNSTVPVDALFYGTGVGSALVSGGTAGYQLPVTDLYNGGKLQSTSFLAPDPASDVIIKASGNYNPATTSWITPRTFTTTTAMTDGTSGISLGMPTPANVGFLSNDTTVIESAGNASIYLKITNPNALASSVDVLITSTSNTSAADYTLAATTITFAANSAANSSQPITFAINDDAIPENSEYLIIKLNNAVNATITGITQFAFYISDNDRLTPAPNNALQLNLLGSFSNGASGSNSAEIVAHDPTTQRLYIANSIGAKLDIVNFADPSNPVLINSMPVTTYGNINSVAVKNGTVVMAIENGTNPQDSGKVVFLDKDGALLKQVTVGMMPDMITFNHAGTKVYTANEGEPNTTYTNDPDGSIAIVDITNGISTPTVSHITFTTYNGQEATLKAQGIRIYGLNASASQDFEPEYITISDDDTKAWVTLQENNAIAELDLTTNSIINIRSLGSKDYSNSNFGIDVSNITRDVNLSNFPVKGLYLPDAISKYKVAGVEYIVTANEGDSRAYNAFNEEKRISALTLDPSKFPNAAELKNNYVLGRLNATDKLGDTDNDGDIDSIFVYGSRSFSIWNASTGQLVYDSGDDFERITSANSYSVMFNASNGNSAAKKDRSDDKGPEPEGVSIGTIGANTYAFIALERIGGVMVYDITNPNNPVCVTYVNNRNAPTNGPDRGAEGIIFIPQSLSPNGQHIVIAANEVSSTLSIYGIPGCTSPINSVLSTVTNTVFCEGDSTAISVAAQAGLNYQWTKNNSPISGATTNTLYVSSTGDYAVQITGGIDCSTTSLPQSFSVNAAPAFTLSAGSQTLCSGQSTTLSLNGSVASYTWSAGPVSADYTITPTASNTYSAIATGSNGCEKTNTVSVAVNPTPTVTANTSSSVICAGESATLTASGATSYTWSEGSSTNASITVTPSGTETYTVNAENNGCFGDAIVTVTVNTLPNVTTSTSNTLLCSGQSAVLTATSSSAVSYTWSDGAITSTTSVSPLTTTDYTVTVNDGNCANMAVITQSVSTCTDINTLSSDNAIRVFPNPFTGSLNIIINTVASKGYTMVIYNTLGEIVYSVSGTEKTLSIPTQEWKSGIYFAHINQTVIKLIKE